MHLSPFLLLLLPSLSLARRQPPTSPSARRRAAAAAAAADSLTVALPNHHRHHPSSPPFSYWPPSSNPVIPATNLTRPFVVDGSAIPNVTFDVGESYAGLLPVSSAPSAPELYFWFFPTANPEASDEILIWLNGGPGCSSLEGLLQENGPFLWQYGTFRPVENPWTWRNLTNVVWVEQPAGTGFSLLNGNEGVQNETQMADQFVGFWKNFIDTFGLHNRKVFITGESYAGYYVPYIADKMFSENDTTYFDVEAIQINDPVLTYPVVQEDLVTVPFVEYWDPLLSLNASYMESLRTRYQTCGYAEFMDIAMTFPPTGPLPTPPNVDQSDENCLLYSEYQLAATLVNPCYDVYQVATTCPLLWDVLGFPGSIPYVPAGATIYFNRTDVQEAINAPLVEWEECSPNVLQNDDSPLVALSILPGVIEKSKRTLIAHGLLDSVLIANGTIISIQNMTWNGAQGFSVPPQQFDDLYVPFFQTESLSTIAGSGVMGKWHTERGLTYASVDLSGHMIPQYAPSVAYRQLEFLLGRIKDLSDMSDFTTQTGGWGNQTGWMTMG